MYNSTNKMTERFAVSKIIILFILIALSDFSDASCRATCIHFPTPTVRTCMRLCEDETPEAVLQNCGSEKPRTSDDLQTCVDIKTPLYQENSPSVFIARTGDMINDLPIPQSIKHRAQSVLKATRSAVSAADDRYTKYHESLVYYTSQTLSRCSVAEHPVFTPGGSKRLFDKSFTDVLVQYVVDVADAHCNREGEVVYLSGKKQPGHGALIIGPQCLWPTPQQSYGVLLPGRVGVVTDERCGLVGHVYSPPRVAGTPVCYVTAAHVVEASAFFITDVSTPSSSVRMAYKDVDLALSPDCAHRFSNHSSPQCNLFTYGESSGLTLTQIKLRHMAHDFGDDRVTIIGSGDISVKPGMSGSICLGQKGDGYVLVSAGAGAIRFLRITTH